MIRYFDTFIRYIWLWLIPLILFPVLISFVLLSTATYTAKASLWIEQPLFGDPNATQTSQYDSPAKQISGLMTELLNTREFVNSVIASTSRQNTIKNQQDQLSAIDYITTKTKVSGDTTRLITLSFPDSTEARAVETLQAIIDRFQDYYNGRVKTQGESSSKYYQQLADSAKSDLDKATNDLKTFIDDHPNQVSADAGTRVSSPEDLEYNKLNQALQDARQRYDAAKNTLDSVLNSYKAYQQGQATTIRVLDKPAINDAGTSKLRQIGLGAGLGLVIGLICSIIGAIILTFLDGVLRYTFYAYNVLGRERILELPNYRVNPKALKQHASKGIELTLADFESGKDKKTSIFKKIFRRKPRNLISLRKTLTVGMRLPFND